VPGTVLGALSSWSLWLPFPVKPLIPLAHITHGLWKSLLSSSVSPLLIQGILNINLVTTFTCPKPFTCIHSPQKGGTPWHGSHDQAAYTSGFLRLLKAVSLFGVLPMLLSHPQPPNPWAIQSFLCYLKLHSREVFPDSKTGGNPQKSGLDNPQTWLSLFIFLRWLKPTRLSQVRQEMCLSCSLEWNVWLRLLLRNRKSLLGALWVDGYPGLEGWRKPRAPSLVITQNKVVWERSTSEKLQNGITISTLLGQVHKLRLLNLTGTLRSQHWECP
jgi:hypothetical protein